MAEDQRKKHSRHRDPQVQRPWGRTPVVAGHCGYRTVPGWRILENKAGERPAGLLVGPAREPGFLFSVK